MHLLLILLLCALFARPLAIMLGLALWVADKLLAIFGLFLVIWAIYALNYKEPAPAIPLQPVTAGFIAPADEIKIPALAPGKQAPTPALGTPQNPYHLWDQHAALKEGDYYTDSYGNLDRK
jgi:hypothetical protein